MYEELPQIVLFGQQFQHTPAFIVMNRAGLKKLRWLLEAVEKATPTTAEVMQSDGEGYNLIIHLADSTPEGYDFEHDNPETVEYLRGLYRQAVKL